MPLICEKQRAMFHRIRYLLLQIRDFDDPMRLQEIDCFSRALQCPPEQIRTYDLLSGVPTRQQLDEVDVVLIGGSGNYSVVTGGPWLPPALEAMHELYEWSKPTFASCWGFQALSRALGGVVVTDLSRAEVGTHQVRLTDAGRQDPVFGASPTTFRVQMGHQDIVDRLPDGAVRLASTQRVENQAYCFPGKPIYCTQFHPELNHENLVDRIRTYPEYIERIAGITIEEFIATCDHSPEAEALLPRFVRHVMAAADCEL